MSYRSAAEDQLQKMEDTFVEASDKARRPGFGTASSIIICATVIALALQAIALAILSLKWDDER